MCGADNPRGIQLRFDTGSDGVVAAEWEASSDWVGFVGVIHGGIVSLLLDEAMGKAVVARQWHALTCELRVRYRHHVAVGEAVHIRGWVVERKRRRISTEASLCTSGGKELAHAWGTFLTVS